ncbi:hypothetical protein EKO04_003104 [Ascochyta lentis]|uniref:Uncharacterized protein n=1 Tax=Ascochyta lentis TaxID=205686 RepID=A0A8H7J939_9PLEO|nr:hypothetical protein EKO04_003104 [Ascochyta lentis]
MAEPPQKSKPKPEPRTAGAPPKRSDVFNSRSPERSDDANPDDTRPGEEKISVWEALKEKGSKAKRKSMQILGMESGKDGKKEGGGGGGK